MFSFWITLIFRVRNKFRDPIMSHVQCLRLSTVRDCLSTPEAETFCSNRPHLIKLVLTGTTPVWMRFSILHVSKLVAVPLGRSSDRGQLASGSSSASRRKQCLRFNLWSAEKLPNTGWHLLKGFFTFPYVCAQLFLIFNPWSTQLCRSFLVMSTSRNLLLTDRFH